MILEELAEYARSRVARAKEKHPLEEIREQALQLAQQQRLAEPELAFRFERALQSPGLAFICEVKKHLPPKGLSQRSSPICRSQPIMSGLAPMQYPV